MRTSLLFCNASTAVAAIVLRRLRLWLAMLRPESPSRGCPRLLLLGSLSELPRRPGLFGFEEPRRRMSTVTRFDPTVDMISESRGVVEGRTHVGSHVLMISESAPPAASAHCSATCALVVHDATYRLE